MKKVYHLSTCDTCERILKELNHTNDLIKQDIKKQRITESELQEMKDLAGSYESLFSRRAMKFRSLGLNEMKLAEQDYKEYILNEYTFLKRPVFIINDQIYIGNSKATIENVQLALQSY